MSTSNQTTDLSAANFHHNILRVRRLKRVQDTHKTRYIETHPFAAAFENSNSLDSVMNVLRRQAQAFDKFRKDDDKLMVWLTPVVNILFTFSETLEEIKHIRKSGTALVAYYYFDFRDTAKRDVRSLLTSLLLQLVDDSDPCWDLLSQLHKTCRDGSEQSSEAALARCLNNMLDLPGQIPTYIILDALDECPNNTGTPSARERVLTSCSRSIPIYLSVSPAALSKT